VDPISLLLLAQSAVSAIRASCQFLAEGKTEIVKFKKQVEGGVSDVKAIYAEVAGLWGWLKSLFGAPKKPSESPVAKQTVTAEPAKPPTKKSKREPEQELSYEEFQARAVHEICENLKVYFESIRQLKIHCRELEEEALTTEKVADSAIDRIEIEWQMKQLSAQLKQSMIYGTPESLGLGALYREFLVKQEEIVEEQEVARELKLKRERDTAWQHEHRNEILAAKLAYGLVVAVITLELIGLYFIL
jgi:hypothetical protein